MAGVFLSDFTKKTLMQFGWTEKDGVPEALGAFLLAAKDRAEPTTRTDVMVDADKMRPEDVETARKMVEAQREQDKKDRAEAAILEKTKNMPPAVADGYRQMLEAEAKLKAQKEQGAPEIVDDREAAANTDTGQQEAPPKQETSQETENTAPAAPEFNDLPPPPIVVPFCPRCGWDMRVKYDTEVTDSDKEAFVAILLGNTRFKKRYSFLNDKFIVTLRSLLADENIEIHRQLVVDHQAGELPTENEWFLRMFEYRLACSMESAYAGDGKPIAIIPALAEVKRSPTQEKEDETGLVYLRKYVNTHVLAHEVTRRMVGQQFRRFQRLIEALEAMAIEPSFWDGIG